MEDIMIIIGTITITILAVLLLVYFSDIINLLKKKKGNDKTDQ